MSILLVICLPCHHSSHPEVFYISFGVLPEFFQLPFTPHRPFNFHFLAELPHPPECVSLWIHQLGSRVGLLKMLLLLTNNCILSTSLLVLDVCHCYYNANPLWRLHACFCSG